MIGQHIYTRSLNEQNNAGTWMTVSDGIVDKGTVKNTIEPRCNIDAAFAQTALSNALNNVLRLYHIDESVTVITRTYWVTSRLTDDARKGAYSIGYIITDKDMISFNNDFAGAFDVNCFESYDSIVERCTDGKTSVNENLSIFSHAAREFDASVFAKVGFTKDSFVKLMNGIYFALENKKKIAVLLPEKIRTDWEVNGDNTVEELSMQIMSLLPDFTRFNFGVTTHWNCQVKDPMVGDTHLVFVHPKSEEELPYFKRENIMLLDLDGKYTTDIPSVADSYFGFLWDNLSKYNLITEFWTEIKDKYRKLLKGRPYSASVMECTYLMRCVNDAKFSDKNAVFRAFMLAAAEFAGAGTRVPDAEAFIYQALLTLGFGKDKIERNVEGVICNLMSCDPDVTKHQVQEYQILLKQCELGIANDETVAALCDEIMKDGRNAEDYFKSYLLENIDIDAKKITSQMTRFVSGLFMNLVGDSSSIDFVRTLIDVMQAWCKTLTKAKNVELQIPFAEAFAAYLEGKGDDTNIRTICYDFLFDFEQKSDGENRTKCTDVLFKEEKRIYKNKNDGFGVDTSFLRYAQSFLGNLYAITDVKRDVATESYLRMFRLAYRGIPEIVQASVDCYKKAIADAEKAGLSDKVLPVLLKCHLDALDQIDCSSEIWNEEDAGKVAALFELTNLENIAQYRPSGDRITILLNWFSKNDVNALRVCKHYLEKLQFGEKQIIYREIAGHNLIDNLFVHALFSDCSDDLKNEIENNFKVDHFQKTSIILTSSLLADSFYNSDEFSDVVHGWYSRSLDKEFSQVSSTVGGELNSIFNRVILEYTELKKVSGIVFGLDKIVSQVLETTAYRFIVQLSPAGITNLSEELVSNLSAVISTFHNDKPENTAVFEMVSNIDNLIRSWDLRRIDEFVVKGVSAENHDIVSNRIRYHIQKESNIKKAQYLWMYCYLLETDEMRLFNAGAFVQSCGYGEKNEFEICNMLVKLLLELYSANSLVETAVGRGTMPYVTRIVYQNSQAFYNDEFLNRCRILKVRDYFKNSGILKILHQIDTKNKLQFNWAMFFKCAVGAVIVSVLAALVGVLLVWLCTVNSILMYGVGAILVVILVALDIIAILTNSKN